jgi:DNA polymerase-3 subunit delta
MADRASQSSHSSPSLATALDVLIAPQDYRLAPITVLAGSDGYLRCEVRRALIASTSASARDGGAEEPPFVEVLEGGRLQLVDLRDALAERSLFGNDARVVIVEEADSFVKNYRSELEELVGKPPADAHLLLEVAQWPANTRLAKQIAEVGLTVRCQVPTQGRELTALERQVKKWLVSVAERDYQVKMRADAVEMLLQKLPLEPGILQQEVAKLALLCGPGKEIDTALVKQHVGGWRAQRTWDMIDAAVEGRAAQALDQLDRLFTAGEEAHALLPQLASTLRHFAMAVRLFEQAEAQGSKPSLRSALESAGIPAFKLNSATSQLQQVGRERARHLYRWLLQADLELKGHNSTKERARRVLELLIVKLDKSARRESPRR